MVHARLAPNSRAVVSALTVHEARALTDHHGDVAHGPDLDVLIRAHHVRLVRLAYVCCGDASAAEDIVADAYARAWPRLSAGQVDEPLAYLRRAVLNRAASWRRHRSVVWREARRRRPLSVAQDASTGIGERDQLLEALRYLPVAQLQVVALRYLEDLSEAETARQLDLPVGTVKSRTARALETLRHHLEERTDG
jgi:RNA polymerase sigma-70 factor (sigma-E family)